MIREAWTFDLEDGRHTVELFWSLWSPRERVLVDGDVVSDERRWSFKSRHCFSISGHACEAILRIGGGSRMVQTNLRVEGEPVEALPCRSLLRPAFSHPDCSGLLHASAKSSPDEPERLLRALDEMPPQPKAIQRTR